MVERFNVRNDGGMFEEEGGQYVDAEDYDNIRKLLTSCADNLLEYAVYTRDQIDELDTAVRELRNAMEES
jgi:hypothetical protein